MNRVGAGSMPAPSIDPTDLEETMTLTLEEAIQRVPFLRDAKEIKTTILKGGITNNNYRIDADGKSYMLRDRKSVV